MKPVDYDQLFPGRFLKAGTLGGKPRTLTIKDVDREKLPQNDGKDKIKGIIDFEETEMQWCLNKTNGSCLASMFGKKLANWIGKRVILFEGNWNGEPALRVWGSPDIDSEFDVTIALPKRKPFVMTMHKPAEKEQA